MSRLQPVIDTAIKSAGIQTVEILGMDWAKRGELEVLKPLQPEALQLETLQGVVGFVKSNPDLLKGLFLQVFSPREVRVYGNLDIQYQTRPLYVKAEVSDRAQLKEKARVDNYQKQEAMMIWLQSAFDQNEKLADNQVAEILRITMLARKSKSFEVADDGFSQTVTIQVGLNEPEKKTLKNPFTLYPFSSFPEIEPPARKFVFRRQTTSDDAPPTFGLFDADSGAWNLLAIDAITQWLREKLPEVTIIG